MLVFKCVGILIILIIYGRACYLVGHRHGFRKGIEYAKEIIEEVRQEKWGY